MARTGGGPSNGTNTDSDTEMDEELLKLYQQRPPSLRVNELGVKERDPEYHCVMEKMRRKQSNFALKKLRHSLLHPPAKASLVQTMEAAVREIKGLQAEYIRQRSEYGRLHHQHAVLQNNLNCLRAELTARGKCSATSTSFVGRKQNSAATTTPPQPGTLSLQPVMLAPSTPTGDQLAKRPTGNFLQIGRRVEPLTFSSTTQPQSQWIVPQSFMPPPLSPVLLPSPILALPRQLLWSPQTTAQGINTVAMVPSLNGTCPPLGGMSSPSIGGIPSPILPLSPCLIHLPSTSSTAVIQNSLLVPTRQQCPTIAVHTNTPYPSSSEKHH